jgi:hypothetical protein
MLVFQWLVGGSITCGRSMIIGILLVLEFQAFPTCSWARVRLVCGRAMTRLGKGECCAVSPQLPSG